MEIKRIVRILLVAGLILLVPFIAMQFTDEVQWSSGDFVTIGALVTGTGLAYELIARKLRSKKHRVILRIALVVVLLYIWAELAVGVFTNLGS